MAKELPSGLTGPNLTAERGASSRVRSYSAAQTFFLMRLANLVQLRREHTGHLPADSWRMRLIHKAIFSTYRDCVSLGIGEDARGLFDKERNRQRGHGPPIAGSDRVEEG